MTYVWLIVGFLLLIKGADYFVAGSSSVAKILRVPSIIIGLTIVAFGTSAPEMAVSVAASLAGNNDIAVGNVVGSNIFNLMMIIGICGIIMKMKIEHSILNKDFWLSILAAVMLFVLVGADAKISRIDGFILLAGFLGYLIYTLKSALSQRTEAQQDFVALSPLKSIVYILGGLAGVVIGGDLVVDSASNIALAFGLSQTLIGLTIVSMGTSLPELVTSVVASRRGENGLALGNVIGSNIFNILCVLSVSSIIHPISVNSQNIYDIVCLIVFSIIAWILARTKYAISRKEGIALVSIYVGYLIYIILR